MKGALGEVAELQSKVATLAEAAHYVHDGARIAFGGISVQQHPMAFIRELIRQEKRDLAVIGTINGSDVDILAGAGCVKRVETSYVGLEQFGLARNFRRKVEQGELQIVDYTDMLTFDRFRASQDNLTFWPCSFLGGNDTARYNPDIKEFACPLTGKRYWAVPPASPDVVVVHAPAADEYGNVLISPRRLLPQSLDVLMTRSCDTVIVTVERIVPHDLVRKHPDLNQIPAYRTTCVVLAPWGAHPTSMLGMYEVDDEHFGEYVAASESDATFQDYLEKYVIRPKDQMEYLELIGVRRMISLQRGDVL